MVCRFARAADHILANILKRDFGCAASANSPLKQAAGIQSRRVGPRGRKCIGGTRYHFFRHLSEKGSCKMRVGHSNAEISAKDSKETEARGDHARARLAGEAHSKARARPPGGCSRDRPDP